jgi:hypothetical protein
MGVSIFLILKILIFQRETNHKLQFPLTTETVEVLAIGV